MGHCVHDQNDECQHCGGQRDHHVGAELIFHLNALCVGRGDCRVGDERKVIAEHRAADYCRYTEGQVQTAALRDCSRYRDKDRYCAYAGAHSHGDQACNNEEPGDGELGGDDGEQKIGCAGCAARLFCDAAERACEQENKQHDRNVVVSDSFGAEMDFFIERNPSILQKSDSEGNSEGNNNGDDIKAHLTFKRVDVLEEDAVSEIQDQEYYNWQQGCRI